MKLPAGWLGVVAWCGVSTFVPNAPAGPLVSNLVARWVQLEAVRCDVRRETETPAGRLRRLSRVHWAAPNRLYVENYTPVRRTIVCDGVLFMSYVDGDPLGFARPVSELPPDMERSLRVVPGTPMDHLLHWLDSDETSMAASGSLQRVVRVNGPPAGQIGLDSEGRVTELTVFDPVHPSQTLATWHYRDYREVRPGVWVPLLHEAFLFTSNGVHRELTRFENYRVSPEPVPPWNDPHRYFPGVRFTNRFDAIYREP